MASTTLLPSYTDIPTDAPTASPTPKPRLDPSSPATSIRGSDDSGGGGFWRKARSRKCNAVGGILCLLILLSLGLGLGLGLRERSEGNGERGWQNTYTLPLATSEGVYPSPRGNGVGNWSAAYEKASRLVSKMSLTEKVNITTGTGWRMGPCVGNTGSAEAAGFPGLCLQDGPMGVRFADSVTVFPAGVTVAGTWDRSLIQRRGEALGREMRGKGVNVMLGPSVVGGKFPAGGRGWEGFGSDPYLAGQAVARTVRGVQSEGVIACVKHFLVNEQETFRQASEGRGQGWRLSEALSSNVGGRALREIYAWPFQDAVREGVGSVMCSYNQVCSAGQFEFILRVLTESSKINNSYGCQNSYLLNGLLKEEFEFQGFVVSDWIAQRSGVASVLAGL